MTTVGRQPTSEPSNPEPASPPASDWLSALRGFRPTFIVWMTISVVVFAGLVALWMYWISDFLYGAPG